MKQKYTVTTGGAPASLQAIKPILGVEVLLPAPQPDQATVFATERAANKAIEKTQKWARTIRGSLIDGHPRLQPLLNSGPFNLVAWYPSK